MASASSCVRSEQIFLFPHYPRTLSQNPKYSATDGRSPDLSEDVARCLIVAIIAVDHQHARQLFDVKHILHHFGGVTLTESEDSDIFPAVAVLTIISPPPSHQHVPPTPAGILPLIYRKNLS
jgi:hypothetical protein